MRVPSRGMTSSSVRKRQQPPSLEHLGCYATPMERLGQRPLDWRREPDCGKQAAWSTSYLWNEEEMEPDDLLCSCNARERLSRIFVPIRVEK